MNEDGAWKGQGSACVPETSVPFVSRPYSPQHCHPSRDCYSRGAHTYPGLLATAQQALCQESSRHPRSPCHNWRSGSLLHLKAWRKAEEIIRLLLRAVGHSWEFFCGLAQAQLLRHIHSLRLQTHAQSTWNSNLCLFLLMPWSSLDFSHLGTEPVSPFQDRAAGLPSGAARQSNHTCLITF